MNCPKCQSEMEKITFADIEVDRCTDCKGIWFDMLEHEKLKEVKGSEAIDTGDPETGKKNNEITKIDCPVCQTQMIPMAVLRQPHIRFESCTSCYGAFFDAGEFKDFKHENIASLFKDLLRKRGTI